MLVVHTAARCLVEEVVENFIELVSVADFGALDVGELVDGYVDEHILVVVLALFVLEA